MSGGIQADVSAGTLVARRAGPLMTVYDGTITAGGNDVTVNLGGEEATSQDGTLYVGFQIQGQAGTGGAGVNLSRGER